MAKETVTIGNVEISAVSDGTMEFDLCNFILLFRPSFGAPMRML